MKKQHKMKTTNHTQNNRQMHTTINQKKTKTRQKDTINESEENTDSEEEAEE